MNEILSTLKAKGFPPSWRGVIVKTPPLETAEMAERLHAGEVKHFAYRKQMAAKEIGAAIKQAREEKGLSGRALAKMLGYSAMFLCDVERGERMAPEGFIAKVKRTLGAAA